MANRSGSSICRVLTILVIVAGIVMSCLTIRNCNFVKTSAGHSIGLFGYIDSESQCVMYDPENRDPYGWLMKWSRVCAILAPIFGFLVILMLLGEFCCETRLLRCFRSIFLSFAEIAQAFTFVLYGSTVCASDSFNANFTNLMLGGCNFSQGSIFSIIALGLYILGGILLCFSPKQEPLCKKDTAEAKPAAAKDEAEKEEEKPVDDVEAGAATAEGGVKAQVY